MAGPRGFFKGLTARVLHSMPATAICWSTYEFFKFYLCGLDREHYKSSITGKNLLQPRETTALIPASIVADATLLHVKEKDANAAAYVVPSTAASATVASAAESTIHPTPSTTPSVTPTPLQPIKTVCDLSSSVTAPTLNLHTRHTDVKSPYDRGFSSP